MARTDADGVIHQLPPVSEMELMSERDLDEGLRQYVKQRSGMQPHRIVNLTSNRECLSMRWSEAGRNNWSDWVDAPQPIGRTCSSNNRPPYECLNGAGYGDGWSYIRDLPCDMAIDIQMSVKLLDQSNKVVIYRNKNTWNPQCKYAYSWSYIDE